MTQPTPPEGAGTPPTSTQPGGGAAVGDEARVLGYVEANASRYSAEAMRAALTAAGHEPELVDDVLARSAAQETAEPVRSRARLAVGAAYGLTVLLLLSTPQQYGFGPIASGILTVVLGFAFWISWWWAGRRGTGMGFAALVAVPAILLVLVGGACYAMMGDYFGVLGRCRPNDYDPCLPG